MFRRKNIILFAMIVAICYGIWVGLLPIDVSPRNLLLVAIAIPLSVVGLMVLIRSCGRRYEFWMGAGLIAVAFGIVYVFRV